MKGIHTNTSECLHDRLVLVMVLMLTAVLSWPLLPRHADYSVDANTYLAGAISLSQGNGYHLITQVEQPRITFYPPLQSAYLSLALRTQPPFPGCINGLNVAMLLLSLCAMAVLFFVLRQNRVPCPIAVLLTLTLGLSPTWFLLVSLLFSDVLFTLIGFLLVWLWFRPEPWPPKWPVPGTGVLLALAYLTRTAALAWLVGAGLVLWLVCHWRRPQIWLMVLLPASLVLSWWRAWTSTGYSYVQDFRERFLGGSYLRHCLDNFWALASGNWLQDALSPAWVRAPDVIHRTLPGASWLVTLLVMLTGLVLVCLCGIGCWRGRDRQTRSFLVVIAVYLAELMLWPFSLGNRVVFVLLPFVLVWAWQGYLVLGQRYLTSAKLQRLAVVALAVNLVINGYLLVRQQHSLDSEAQLAELHAAADWLKINLPDDARIVVGSKVSLTYLWAWTGRSFIGGDATVLPRRIAAVKSQYLVDITDSQFTTLPVGWGKEELFRSQAGTYQVSRLVPRKPGNITQP